MNIDFQVSVLASGSKGNCFLVKCKDTTILIDAGITYKNYAYCLSELGLDPLSLGAIFISHEHTDHVGGAGVLHRKTGAPIYISAPTLMYSQKKIGNVLIDPITFDSGENIIINDIMIHPFASSHDAVDGCNFILYPYPTPIDSGTDAIASSLAIVTDTGYATKLLKNNLSKVTTIVLESNHDLQMLKTGPYDWHLKQRIMSRTGHLSNDQATELIAEIINQNHKRIILAHLSEINNTPQIAYTQMKKLLDQMNASVELNISTQHQHTQLFDI
jgi:phosphoribosyl 1,2-cyclic phosphodiesterase